MVEMSNCNNDSPSPHLRLIELGHHGFGPRYHLFRIILKTRIDEEKERAWTQIEEHQAQFDHL